jgi:hypothetical protein
MMYLFIGALCLYYVPKYVCSALGLPSSVAPIVSFSSIGIWGLIDYFAGRKNASKSGTSQQEYPGDSWLLFVIFQFVATRLKPFVDKYSAK